MQDVFTKGVLSTKAEYSAGVIELLVTMGVALGLVIEPTGTNE
jgi:hypothetical protein